MKREYHYVTQMGGIWRLNKTAYQKLRRLVSEGAEYDLDALGTLISMNVENVADMREEN